MPQAPVALAASVLAVDEEKAVAMDAVGSGCRRSFPEGFRARPSEERMDDVRRTADEERLLLMMLLLSPGRGGIVIVIVMVGETVVEVCLDPDPEEGTGTANDKGDCVREEEAGTAFDVTPLEKAQNPSATLSTAITSVTILLPVLPASFMMS